MSKRKDSKNGENEIENNKKHNDKRANKQGKVSRENGNNIKQISEIKHSKASKVFGVITLIGLLSILFYSPYLSGLYFYKEMSSTFLYSGILFLIFLIYNLINKDFRIFKSWLDITAGALVIAYLLPIVFDIAATAEYAWDDFLRYVNYFLIYLIARDLVAGYKNITIILNGIIVSAVGVSVLGIDAGAGLKLTGGLNAFFQSIPKLIHISGGAADILTIKLNPQYLESRIFSTLQYPNVLASYLSAIFFIITGLLVYSNKEWKRFLYGAAGFIIFYTLVLTSSRGMFIIFPFMYLLLLILLRNKKLIIDAIVFSAIPAIIGIILSVFYTGWVNTSQYTMVWISVLAGALISGAFLLPMKWVKQGLYKVNTKVYIIELCVLVLVFVVAIGIGLGQERPLVIKHDAVEKPSEKAVIRDITRVKTGTKYTLEFKVNAIANKPNIPAYKIVVNSINAFAEQTPLAEMNAGTENTAKKLEFTTKQDTKMLRLYMSNYNQGTSVAFSGFNLKDISTGATKRIIAQYAYLPTDLIYKIKDINLKTHNAWQRMVFVQDAFKVILDHPLGAGGGGWRALYHKYQSYLYFTTEVHNYPVQLWVETGIIGFIILVSFIGLIIHHFYKTRRRFKEVNEDTLKKIILPSAIFTAVMSLYAHSVIDFDFSLSAVILLAWTLTALISAYFVEESKRETVKGISVTSILGMIVGVVAALTLVVTGINSVYGRTILSERAKYGTQFTLNQLKAAAPSLISIYDRYLALQPYDQKVRQEYIKLYLELAKNGKKEDMEPYMPKFKENIDKSIEYEPYLFTALMDATSFYFYYGSQFTRSLNEINKAAEYAGKSVEYGKFIASTYETKAYAYLTTGQILLNSGQADLGKKYLNEVKNMKSEIDEVNATAVKPMEIPETIPQAMKQADEILASKK